MNQTSNGRKALFDIHAPVFYPAAIIILIFISLTLIIGKPMEQFFVQAQNGISNSTGWFLVLAVNIFVAFCIYLAFSRFGAIRLGGQQARPDFSTFAWFAMLFSAGMGIGLLFFSVAEPISHFTNPPGGVASDVSDIDRARNAMRYTFLHYGLHAWGIYALVGLALAFFTFNWKLPLSIRSVLYPLLGDRIYGPIGHFIDVVAVVATLFGLATSLGFGAQQINSGLSYLTGLPNTLWVQVVLIGIITGAATISVVLGLDKGVRVLSELNMRLAMVFLIAMILIGPTIFLFDGFVQNTGTYLQKLLEVSTWTEAYTGQSWQNSWTVVYWAWWISWSPFVGMFIARVSRGRTIRQFVLGVLLVPSLLSFLWMSVFGNSALHLELNDIGNIGQAVEENISTALFVMLDQYPWASVTSVIGILLVTSFFVTSSDSGSLVIDSITSGGKLDAPVGQRIFWALAEGAVPATLLIGGGLRALQTAAIATGLPFCIILIVMCFGLYKGLEKEDREMQKRLRAREEESYKEVLADLITKSRQKSQEQ
jgi:choline/glycine/proline betaine transport protein